MKNMGILVFNVQEPYRTALLDNTKTIEGRLNKGKFATLQVGDILQFDSGEKFEVQTIGKYSSFREMLSRENIKVILPNIDTIDEGEQIYYQFYTQQDEQKYGVLAIEIKRIY